MRLLADPLPAEGQQQNIKAVSSDMPAALSAIISGIFTFSERAKKMFTTTYLDEQGNEVAYATEGAISLLQFITNKNWTVTFA